MPRQNAGARSCYKLVTNFMCRNIGGLVALKRNIITTKGKPIQINERAPNDTQDRVLTGLEFLLLNSGLVVEICVSVGSAGCAEDGGG